MRFTIAYGLTDAEDIDDTLMMNPGGEITHHVYMDAPDLPAKFDMRYETYQAEDDIQVAYWTIEISSLDDLLEIARLLRREVLLEQQPTAMREHSDNALPEFCLSIGDPIDEDSDEELDDEP